MSQETQHVDEPARRDFEREERRLVRLRSVVELHTEWSQEPEDDFDPDPKEAA